MNSLTPSQLTYTGVFLAVLANQLCLPVPAVIFLMAAGAFSAQGRMQATLVVLLGVVPCLVADTLWFCMGKRWGLPVIHALCRLAPDPPGCERKARRVFARFGQPLLACAKFVPGLDGVIPPLAGAQGVALDAFLALDGLGSLLWVAFYVAVGYLFSAQLELAVGWVRHLGTALLVLIALPFGLYAGRRALPILFRFLRHWRPWKPSL